MLKMQKQYIEKKKKAVNYLWIIDEKPAGLCSIRDWELIYKLNSH